MAELSMREAYGKALLEMGAVDEDIVVLDPDTSSSTLSCLFARRYPERFFNVGIAEPCMVDLAAGLALGGKRPFANAFAALLAFRAMEQIRTCVCYARTNVKLVSGYAGLSDYKDGPTHHAISDIAAMRSLPNMTVIVPADAEEAARWVPILARWEGPAYFRISRAGALSSGNAGLELVVGKGLTLRSGGDLTIVAAGTMVGRSLLAAEKLASAGIDARVIQIHTIKPLDAELLERAAEETGCVVTAEEHSIVGGLGGAVAELLGDRRPVPIERVGIADCFARTAPDPESLMDAYGLSVGHIAAAAERALARKK